MFYTKPILAISFLLIPFIINTTKHSKVDLIDEGTLIKLNGDVKQVSVITNDSLSANPGPLSSDSFKFNRQGNETEKISESHMGVFRNYYITQYSTDGKKLKILGYYKPNDVLGIPDFFPNQVIQVKDSACNYNEIYRYDEHGYITKYVFKSKNIMDSSIYKYDLKGNLIESDSYAHNHPLAAVIKYIYDEKNNLIESDEILKNILRVKKKYQYNKTDLYNNWLDETVYLESFWIGDQINIQKIHREINYYK